MVGVGGADQGKVGLVGDGKDDAPVSPLKEIAFIVVIQPFGDDMTAPHQPHPVGRGQADGVVNQVADPGATGVDEHSGAKGLWPMFVFDRYVPVPVGLPG